MKQPQEDTIITEFLKSLGPWREFIVVGVRDSRSFGEAKKVKL